MKNANHRFLEAATALGVVAEPTIYREGARTALDAAAAVGCDVAQIVKSLVFMAGDRPILALTSGANRVDLQRLAAAIEVDGQPPTSEPGVAAAPIVRRANADEVRSATGYAIGGTPPFGHSTQLLTFVDEDLLLWDKVWAAAGTPDSCFPIAPRELARVSAAVVAAFAEQTE